MAGASLDCSNVSGYKYDKEIELDSVQSELLTVANKLAMTDGTLPSSPPPQQKYDIAKELKSNLVADLACGTYTKNAKIINKINDNAMSKKISSYYMLTKDLPPVIMFTCSYRGGDPDSIELDSDGEEIVSEEAIGNNDVIVTCDRAYVTITNCVELMLNKMREVVK